MIKKDVVLSKPYTWFKLQSLLRKCSFKVTRKRKLVQPVIIVIIYYKIVMYTIINTPRWVHRYTVSVSSRRLRSDSQ